MAIHGCIHFVKFFYFLLQVVEKFSILENLNESSFGKFLNLVPLCYTKNMFYILLNFGIKKKVSYVIIIAKFVYAVIYKYVSLTSILKLRVLLKNK